MSSVYRAHRADGQFDQTVALKIMAAYLAGPEFLRRFETERQLLASLSHNHITRLLDGGARTPRPDAERGSFADSPQGARQRSRAPLRIGARPRRRSGKFSSRPAGPGAPAHGVVSRRQVHPAPPAAGRCRRGIHVRFVGRDRSGRLPGETSARRMVAFTNSIFLAPNAMRDVLESASRRMSGELKDDPLAELTLRTTLARTLMFLGMYQRATEEAERASLLLPVGFGTGARCGS